MLNLQLVLTFQHSPTARRMAKSKLLEEHVAPTARGIFTKCNNIAAMCTPHTAPYLAQFLNRARQKFDCLATRVTEDRQFGCSCIQAVNQVLAAGSCPAPELHAKDAPLTM